MKLKQRIIRNLEWANKRLKLQGKELDETQLEIIEFCLLHDLKQLNIPVVVQQSEQLFCGVDGGFCPYEESDKKCRAEHKCINQVAK